MFNNKKITLPKPYPDSELYDSVLNAGFEKYPKRYENYLKWQKSSRSIDVDYLPIKMDIENVSRCNFHCTMCSVSDWPKYTRARDMTFEEYMHLIDEQYGLIEIKLQGLGEPLMGKCYFEMIQYARKNHIWVRTVTNASLLHIKENYKNLIDSDVSELLVSIDGATKKTFEKIRRGSNFEKVKENCITLNHYAENINKKRTRMWTLVQRDNFHELEDMVILSAKLGFERMTFSLDVENQAWSEENREKIKDYNKRSNFNMEYGLELVELGKNEGVEVTFWLTNEKFESIDPSKLCPWPFERALISSDMRIVPCCMIANPEIYELGDSNKLLELWNGKTYQEFRKNHINGNIPDICCDCYLNVES